MVVAIVLVLLILGSLCFTPEPVVFHTDRSNWQAMDDTISITFWVTGFVFVAINCSWPMP